MAVKNKKKEIVEEKLELEPESTVVSVIDTQIVRPMVSPQQAAANWKAYQELCKAILEPSDYVTIPSFNGRVSTKKAFKIKSAWRKLATAFNLSVEILKEERVDSPDGNFVVKTTARVIAPNGRHVDGTGSCSSKERSFAHLEHDVRAQAETRAKNRAIADMIGGGEVSAEEVMQMEEEQKNKCPRDHEALPLKIVSSEGNNKGRSYVKCPACNYFKWLDDEKPPLAN